MHQSRTPVVSICIPTFNGAEYLPEAFSSVENQRFRELAVLISDDGSTDGTWGIACEYQKNASFPVTLLKHKQDSLAGNWNFCVSQAKTEYIKYLFQDDLLEPECVETMIDIAARSPSVGLVFSPRHLLAMEDATSDPDCSIIMKHFS